MTEALLSHPAPRISIEGEELAQLTRDLAYLRIEECNEGLKHVEARFIAFGPRQGSPRDELLYLDGCQFDFGHAIEVGIDEASVGQPVFKGTISAIRAAFEEGHEPEVTICAEDDAMKLRLTRRCHTYKDKTDAEIAEELAGFHGLTPCTDTEGPTHDVVQQWNMSDLAFLRERARRIQAEIWVEDGQLNFKARNNRDGAEITLVQGNHLISLHAAADLAHQRAGVHVSGYNADRREVIDAGAQSSVIRDEQPRGRSGADIFRQVFPGDLAASRVRDMPLTDTEAEWWSRYEMLRRARGFVTVHGVTRGNPEMRVGSRLNLDRVGSPFNGPGYYVVEVSHSYDLARGYRTTFSAERGAIEVNS